MRTNPSFPVLDPTASVSGRPAAIVGAGPVGLAAAAELAERHIPFIVFDIADDIAGSVREWGHVQLFSPWRYNIAPAARRLLERPGWNAPDLTAHPTGAELIEQYLAPLALLPEIAAGIRTHRIVVGISRVGVDKVRSSGRDERPFLITAETPRGPERAVVRAVIDASGTWLSPNPLGADGRPAMGETRAEAWIDVGIPDVLGADRRRYKRRRIAVVGSGHSAQNVVRDLATLSNRYPETRVTWIVRHNRPSRRHRQRVRR